MQALREIQTADTNQVFIKIPKDFLHRRLEIIVIPIEGSIEQGWPSAFFEQTAGCFSDCQLVREDQGKYEERSMIKF